jgi:hypothetical protein
MLQLSNKIHAHLLHDTLIFSHGLDGSTAEVKAAETVSEEDGGDGVGERGNAHLHPGSFMSGSS